MIAQNNDLATGSHFWHMLTKDQDSMVQNAQAHHRIYPWMDDVQEEIQCACNGSNTSVILVARR